MSDTYQTVPLEVPADLCESSLRDALNMIPEKLDEDASCLIVHPQDAVLAGRLADKYNIDSVFLLPIIKPDNWAIQTYGYLVYSTGA